MRFGPCPIIAHLVLEAKGIPYHTVNINLTDKPEWLFEANPLGRVPCLQLVDKPGAPFVYESLLIAEYLVLDEVYPEPKIFPIDPLEKLQEKLWIERFTPITLKFYGAWMAKDPVVAIATWSETLDLLDVYETELKRRCTTYFGGDKHPTILDYALWPHFMRFEIVDQLFGAELSSARFPALVCINGDTIWAKYYGENDLDLCFR